MKIEKIDKNFSLREQAHIEGDRAHYTLPHSALSLYGISYDEKEKRFVELRGTKAGFTWNDDGTCGIWTEDEDGKLVDLKPDCGAMGNGHGRALEHFSKIVLDGAEMDYVPQQGVDMIKILDAIYESAKTGREVIL